jgi:hypothetical protein
MKMGQVVPFAKPVSEPATPKRQKRKVEPQGFFLVPRRVLSSLARFEASLDAVAHLIPTDVAQRLDWHSWYEIEACLSDSAKYD